MANYSELQREIARLMQQAESARKAEVSAVIAEIKAKMAEYGITAADLGSAGRSSRAKGTTVAAVTSRRNPATRSRHISASGAGAERGLERPC